MQQQQQLANARNISLINICIYICIFIHLLPFAWLHFSIRTYIYTYIPECNHVLVASRIALLCIASNLASSLLANVHRQVSQLIRHQVHLLAFSLGNTPNVFQLYLSLMTCFFGAKSAITLINYVCKFVCAHKTRKWQITHTPVLLYVCLDTDLRYLNLIYAEVKLILILLQFIKHIVTLAR